MDRFKFLHAADIHLDSPLRGLSRYEGVPVEAVRLATRTALNNLIDAAIDEQVSFLVIAGDLYDGDWDHFGTGLFFCGAMRRLNDAGIEVYITLGNHDAESVQTKRLPLPPNVHVFDHKAPKTLIHAATGTALHGQSYKDRDPGGDLAAAYPMAQGGRLNIGVLHTALTGGRPPHAPYAPCSPAELAAKGYNYWALGHVHAFEVVATDPYIVFPGNLQGRNIRECGPKGAVLVEVSDNAIVSLEPVAFDAVRWTRIDIDVSPCAKEQDIHSLVQEALRRVSVNDADGRPLMARVTLTGATKLHGPLGERLGQLREEIRAMATNVSDELWIEKIKLATEPMVSAGSEFGDADDIATLLAEGANDSDLQAALAADYGPLIGRLPADLGEDSEILAAARQGACQGLLMDAAAQVRARLEEGLG